MKKILCLVLLVGFGYPQTGNDFLEEYPFGKKVEHMTDNEFWSYVTYTQIISGISSGNHFTLYFLGLLTEEKYSIYHRICGMTLKQQIRIIKKWCDDNPSETDKMFNHIAFIAFLELPARSDEECSQSLERMK